MKVEPQKEHAWLQRLVGEWTAEGDYSSSPDEPRTRFGWTDTTRSIGGVWIMSEGHGEMPDGSPTVTMMTLGYDPQKARFVGTFLGSMMTNLWLYEGTLDAAGKVLTLDAEGPSMAGDGTTRKYQDVITLESDDHRTLTSLMQGDDGEYHEFMTAHLRRKA